MWKMAMLARKISIPIARIVSYWHTSPGHCDCSTMTRQFCEKAENDSLDICKMIFKLRCVRTSSNMMTLWHGNAFRVTGPFWGEPPVTGWQQRAFVKLWWCFFYASLNNLSTKQSGSQWHDDAIKWKHFPRYWPFVRGIHRSRWICHTKASDAELWWFLWSASE